MDKGLKLELRYSKLRGWAWIPFLHFISSQHCALYNSMFLFKAWTSELALSIILHSPSVNEALKSLLDIEYSETWLRQPPVGQF